MTDFNKVQEFNRAADQPCPDQPEPMSTEEVLFLSKMILDELSEFMVTKVPNYKEKIIEMINESRDLVTCELDSDSVCAEQGDALVDMYYYSLNAAAKKGIDLSKIFNHVHEANMNKRDKTTGKFIKRSDGKILKPEGWKAPDILSLIKQMKLNSQDINSSDINLTYVKELDSIQSTTGNYTFMHPIKELIWKVKTEEN